jgi:hypothetical protein
MSPTKSSLPVPIPVAVYALLVAGVNVPVRAQSLAVHRVALLPSLSLVMLSSSPIGGMNTVLLLPLLPLLRTLP